MRAGNTSSLAQPGLVLPEPHGTRLFLSAWIDALALTTLRSSRTSPRGAMNTIKKLASKEAVWLIDSDSPFSAGPVPKAIIKS
jgi:hypothetical protein